MHIHRSSAIFLPRVCSFVYALLGHYPDIGFHRHVVYTQFVTPAGSAPADIEYRYPVQVLPAEASRMSERPKSYRPALHYDWLTGLYDFVMYWTMRERTFKARLVGQMALQGEEKILDVGCGTATLTLLIKRTHPGATVVGLDADPKALGIARRKAIREGLEVALHQGMSFSLPFPDGSFAASYRACCSIIYPGRISNEPSPRSCESSAQGASSIWRTGERPAAS
jgi:SAM-dependent methyltransferase